MGRNWKPCALLEGTYDCIQLLWKMARWLLKKLKIELTYALAISLQGIFPKELKARVGLKRYLHTPMFTAALFTIAKRWEQLRGMDEDNVYPYYGILFTLKEECSSDTCYTWMNLEYITLRNKPVTKIHILPDSTYMRYLKPLYS